MDDVSLRRLGILIQHGLGSEDHPRCAKTALKGKLVDKCLLDRVECAVSLGESLDRQDAISA